MKCAEYVVSVLEGYGFTNAFCVTGGAVSGVMDALRDSKIKTVHNHHEQACAMAAEGYTRVLNRPALVVVTNGPGVTNLVTGVAGAFQDSIPMLVVSGQVPTSQQLDSVSASLRQLGVQEVATQPLAESISVHFRRITSVNELPDALDDALVALEEGRLGPVWLEIPLDVQNSPVPDNWDRRSPSNSRVKSSFDLKILECTELLSKSSRPLIIAGNGVHLSGAESHLRSLVQDWGIPVVTTWSASDIFSFQNENYIGNLGILGQRAANNAVQKADLLLILGSRLSIPCIGYASEKFAPAAKKIMVDIDQNEIVKETMGTVDVPVVADVEEFLSSLLVSKWRFGDISPWRKYLRDIKSFLSLEKEAKKHEPGFIDSYRFIEALSAQLSNEIVVTDMGTSFTCTMQALKCNGQNRLFTSSGLSSMGYGLPGAVGAWVADKGPVICIAGDGGFLMNIQELQTIVDNKMDVKIFILDSNGYLAISIMQDNSFGGRRFGSDPASGVGSPDFLKVSESFGIPSVFLDSSLSSLESQIRNVLDSDGPLLCVVPLSPTQTMRPRVMSSKNPITGQFESPRLDSMWPELQPEAKIALDDALLELERAGSRTHKLGSD